MQHKDKEMLYSYMLKITFMNASQKAIWEYLIFNESMT